jgi:hypothetical protein
MICAWFWYLTKALIIFQLHVYCYDVCSVTAYSDV